MEHPDGKARVLIVGVGSPIRTDDGVGWQIARELSRELPANDSRDIQVIATHQLTPEISDTASHAERVLFVDASHSGKPGWVRCERVVPAALAHRHSHHLSPANILKLVEELYGRRPSAFLLTVTGASFAIGETLSPAIAAVVPAVKAQIMRFIESGLCLD